MVRLEHPLVVIALGLLASSAFSAEFIDQALPRTLEEAKHWWSASQGTTFVVPTAPVPTTPLPSHSSIPTPESFKRAPQSLAHHKARLLTSSMRLIKRLGLSMELGGFADDLRADEEYRLEKNASGGTMLVFSNAFWNRFFSAVDTDRNHYRYATYLVYVLLRAGAEGDYMRRFNPDQCAWLVQEDAERLTPSLRLLRNAMETPPTSWLSSDGPVGELDENFRRSLDPSGNPAKTIASLTHYGLKALSQRAADLYALEEYKRTLQESPTSVIRRRVEERERVLAWDFSRARTAMTLAERIAFRKVLSNSYQVYVPDYASSTP